MNQPPDQPNWDKTQQNSMKWSEDRGEKAAAPKPAAKPKAKRPTKKR